MGNRSVPTDTVLPHIIYQDVAGALEWLTKTFGFTEHYRYGAPGGPVDGAQVRFGDAWIQLARDGRANPPQPEHRTAYVTLFVGDVDAHLDRVRSAGATIVEDLNETSYGERQYGVEDLEGNRWLFSQHVRDVDPRDWGATVSGG